MVHGVEKLGRHRNMKAFSCINTGSDGNVLLDVSGGLTSLLASWSFAALRFKQPEHPD